MIKDIVAVIVGIILIFAYFGAVSSAFLADL